MRTSRLPFFSRLNTDSSDERDTRKAPPLSKKFAWKRFAIGACILVTLVVLLGPRHQRAKVLSFGQDWYSNSGAHNKPNSPETDPDPEKTVYCTKSHDPSKPLVQYALMIDAGSTGSRIHIYKFHNCLPQPTYEYEVFRQERPGLSHFEDSPVAAAQSLDALMDVAVQAVPRSLHSCTPVAVKATAGLRRLGLEKSRGILEAVKTRLESRYPFSLNHPESVVIMDGKDEGVYAWITANYLFNRLGEQKDLKSNTYAVLDLGGASTQIVFEPLPGPHGGQPLHEGEHKYLLTFAGRGYELYQHSFLNYGLMAARQSVHKLAEFMSSFNSRQTSSDPATTKVIPNPCISVGTSRIVDFSLIDLQVAASAKEINMTGSDIASFIGCRRLVELVLAKDAICLLKPCSFNGVYQPSILDTFSGGSVLLLSYFYDRLAPLLETATTDSPILLRVHDIAELAQKVCAGQKSWAKHFRSNEQAMVELMDRPEYCLDLTFMYTLLRLGYEFEDHRQVTIAKQVDGTELGWALGAAIALAGATLECKA